MNSNEIRIGYGYDVHRLVEERPLILGGVEVPNERGLAGHSDADVLLHALCDALLGAAALGDIGRHFPDSSREFENIDSRILLRRCLEMINEKGYGVGNVDATVVAQEPRLSPYTGKMRKNIAEDLKLEIDHISVKATTSESLGFEGRREGIAASAVVLIFKQT